jgi:repressor of nif and glnA expression
MKIDQIYLKGMLGAFESAEAPTTDIQELERKGFKYSEDAFIFHLGILADQGFVQREQGHGLGYKKGAGGDISWSVVPLRLTAQGHDFIEALNNSQVWDTIKTEFKDASIGTLWKVSKGLLEGYTKKKIEALISSVD